MDINESVFKKIVTDLCLMDDCLDNMITIVILPRGFAVNLKVNTEK